MTKDQTIAAALQVTDVLIILAKALKTVPLDEVHVIPIRSQQLGLICHWSGRTEDSQNRALRSTPNINFFLKESEKTKLPRYGTAVYVREAEKCTKIDML